MRLKFRTADPKSIASYSKEGQCDDKKKEKKKRDVRIIVEIDGYEVPLYSIKVTRDRFNEIYNYDRIFEYDGPLKNCERDWTGEQDDSDKVKNFLTRINNTTQLDLNLFYKSDESLWRYIRYGDEMTSYDDPFSQASLSSKPTSGIEKRIDGLKNGKIPCKLEKRKDFIKGIIRKLNGDLLHNDGVIFFLDWFRYGNFMWASHMENDNKYWNYLYGFRDKLGQPWVHYMKYVEGYILYLMKSHYKYWSKNASQIGDFLKDNPSGKWNTRGKFIKNENIHYDLALKCLSSILNIPQNDINTLFTGNRPYLALYWFSFDMLKELVKNEDSLNEAFRLADEINEFERYSFKREAEMQFGSINDIQRYLNRLRRHRTILDQKKRRRLGRKFVWNNDLKQILDEISENNGKKWWIPTTGQEIEQRGDDHNLCIGTYNKGMYIRLHFHWDSSIDTKNLIIFSESSTAHLEIFFEKGVVSRAEVIQNKIAGNNDSNDKTPMDFADILKGKPCELFKPVNKK
jgi:hypothetical protein